MIPVQCCGAEDICQCNACLTQRVQGLQAKNTELDQRLEKLEELFQTAAPHWEWAVQEKVRTVEALIQDDLRREEHIADNVVGRIQWQLDTLKNLLRGETEAARCLPLASLIEDLRVLCSGGFVNGRRLVRPEQ